MNNFTIVLEKGEAKCPYYELTESERQEVGRQIFEKVTLAALAVGCQPVTSHTISKRRKSYNSLNNADK